MVGSKQVGVTTEEQHRRDLYSEKVLYLDYGGSYMNLHMIKWPSKGQYAEKVRKEGEE